ncbi:MAG TPA: GH116 family glycosyl hydrolase, partial [Terrimicrobiaceae bacterium]|nr:GH116 family glycosyl hydrolase [Terrimicrobiaceae bacterium]
AFGLLHIKGKTPVTRLLEGPLPPEVIFNQGLQAQGFRQGNYLGLPRFSKAVFTGEFPFGHVELTDPAVPLRVRLTAFNPFIPLDDKNSGLPCAILEYAFENKTRQPVRFEFSYHLSHLCQRSYSANKGEPESRTKAIPGRGVFYSNACDPQSEKFGTACLMALAGRVAVKGMWFRGGWFDAVSALWREVSAGEFSTNDGHNGIDVNGPNGGSIQFRGVLPPGGRTFCPLVIAWHFPNSGLRAGNVPSECCGPDAAGDAPAWRPWYAGQWKDAAAVAEYARTNFSSLRRRTLAFKDALFSSPLPREVIEAVSSNLAILKSPTVLRQENGNIWGWEGCFTQAGCCAGTCTHVWNYAQSLCHLFPALERTIREQELVRSLNEEGHMDFRAALPAGPSSHIWGAAADGQLGSIMKLFRDWQISGDTAWLRGLYAPARLSLEYCVRTWDPERRGALFEPHHNTYDIEFWGPDGMCSSIYVGALSAMSTMALALGETDDARAYGELAGRGAQFLDRELFNGEYYQQNVQYKGLRNQSFLEQIRKTKAASSEVVRLLKKEGPKYQYGSGCLSDGIIGAWMARLYGIETPLNPDHVRSTLKAIHRHNLKSDLSTHANPQRCGYAVGREAGLLLCTWPRGGKPTLPFVYSEEVWTGIEYQVATHLILEGLVDEGLEIVRATRSRYDGRTRNPFNEYECGSYYARAMASYALVQAMSGFRYSAVSRTLWFEPRIARRPFHVFFSTEAAFGTVTLDRQSLRVSVVEGSLPLERIIVTSEGRIFDQRIKMRAKPRFPAEISLKRARVGEAAPNGTA